MVRLEGQNRIARLCFLFPYKLLPGQGSQAADPPFLSNQPEGRNGSVAESAQLEGSSSPLPLPFPFLPQPSPPWASAQAPSTACLQES